MSGHNKWSKIKRQKEKTDAQKSKIFGKMVRVITVEAKKSNGQMTPSLRAAVDAAKAANVPADNIDRAIKKASEPSENLDSITYEAYGPGGCALIIDALTSNRNKAAQEIKHILSKHGFALAAPGSAQWAFTKSVEEGWVPNSTVPISEADGALLETLMSDLEDNDEVQDVYTNAE
ncbi:MAG TPA: YebC/PmpR family DNA-binding transcriptional regulator [Candidatus Paceibacterota bacterium]|jgi:YebC/PmpR family DNA-binding regulatory protein|nr:YebC/PmpR family DNA-binding transcriptional regulator [Candidatus Paceibacterota bacterium]